MSPTEWNRRSFLKVAAAAGAAVAIPDGAISQAPTDNRLPGNSKSIRLKVNGTGHQLAVDTRTTLLDVLREQLGMPGTKKGCDHGQCGACTVHVNGRRINSCLTFAVMHEGEEITAIEGLAGGEALHPVQSAFVEHDAFQCGYGGGSGHGFKHGPVMGEMVADAVMGLKAPPTEMGLGRLLKIGSS